MEGLARGHLAKGDTEANITSALVTAEWMAGNMPGWGRAAAFHSMVLAVQGQASVVSAVGHCAQRGNSRFCANARRCGGRGWAGVNSC